MRRMTEWNASEYARISALQAAMAREVLSLLELKGTEQVLDIGCGNGKTTAEIAARLPHGSVVGVDASADMIAFGRARSGLSESSIRRGRRAAIALPARVRSRRFIQCAALDSATGPGPGLIHTLRPETGRAGAGASGAQRRAEESRRHHRGNPSLLSLGRLLQELSRSLSSPDRRSNMESCRDGMALPSCIA